MDEQQINCIIGACCCEADCADKKRKALGELIKKHLGHGPYEAKEIADFMLSTFDFAPKGKLSPLMEEVARLIKAGAYQG
jgi:hypothetical protein